MDVGPLELLVVEFPGNHFKGEIVPAIKDLVDGGTIRVVDIVFVTKDDEGDITVAEINDLDDDDYLTFNPVVEDVTGLLSDTDIDQVSELLRPNSSAGLMLFEHTWATRLQKAILGADGQVVASERIPHERVEAALAAASV